MTHSLEFNRLSNFVEGVLDRKLQSLSMSLTSSVGYLQGIVDQTNTNADRASDFADDAGQKAQEAGQSAASSLIVWNEFTSTYAGISATDPARSKINNPLLLGAFYIRSTDGRLRYVSGFQANGNPIYSDATVAADASSILTGGVGVFLAVNETGQQTVKGPVTFQGPIVGPRVTSWTSNQLTTATDVDARITAANQRITDETTARTTAITNVRAEKVDKAGDVMTGRLAVHAAGDNAHVEIRETSSNGRTWRFHSSPTGSLRILDTNSGLERLTISPSGVVNIGGSSTVVGTSTAGDFITNRTDNNDSGLSIQHNGVTRWRVRRSFSSSQFYISRMSASGVLLDTPFLINEADGSILQNPTTFKDSVTVSGSSTLFGGVIEGSSQQSGVRIRSRNNPKTGYIAFGNGTGKGLGCEPDDPTLRYNGQPIAMGSSGGGDPGDIKWTARSTPPSGWLKANGDLVSRTTYSDLFAAIGTMYGAGDGSTTFKLPDLRGEFVRGLDDGRGVDTGRTLGSSQGDAFRSHDHSGSSGSAGSHSHTGSTGTEPNHAHNGTVASSNGGSTLGVSVPTQVPGATATRDVNVAGTHSHTFGTSGAGAHSHTVSTTSAGSHSHSINIGNTGGTETRPRNVALLALIKF